jgi:hypothetical protein
MRHPFIPQISLGATPIEEIQFDHTSRHELVPILMALQHLYVNCKVVMDHILSLIAEDISSRIDNKRGCIGLSYWENLVLTALRLGCNLNFDQLADLASHHHKVRQILGLSKWDNQEYKRSTLQDNFSGLKADTIRAIDQMVVECGHQLVKDPLKRVRGDSFVLKKNIHHPTDSSLIVDGIRKVVNISTKIADQFSLPGWRQHDYLNRRAKRTLRSLSQIARGRQPDRDSQMKAAYIDLIEQARQVVKKADLTLFELDQLVQEKGIQIHPYWRGWIDELHFFIAGCEYACEISARRMLAGKTLTNTEKTFSLFEPDTELINRGKRPNPIEFGHRVLILEDNAGFILYGQQMGMGLTDEKVIVEVMQRLQSRFNGGIRAASFDKGFWTPDNLKQLSEIIPLVVLPKKGKRKQADQQREGAKPFGKVRKWHAGVESKIHALVSANGMDVCRDKGAIAYERYIAAAVMGRNLQTLGTVLLAKEREKRKGDNPLLALVG